MSKNGKQWSITLTDIKLTEYMGLTEKSAKKRAFYLANKLHDFTGMHNLSRKFCSHDFFRTNRAVSQLKVELQFAIKFSYFREFWKSTKVQFIGQKLNFNFCPTHGLTFLSCNSNEVQRERSGPL